VPAERFRHVDAHRTILFGPGAVEDAAEPIGTGFTLLSTARAMQAVPSLAPRAGAVVEVPSGLVEDVAGELRARVRGERLVALGGGRVVDVAKALAAADPPRIVIAIPTTLSAAEMTGAHRHARGVPAGTPHARPALVVNDPALSASQPPALLAASSANALAHALAAVASERATPLSAAVGREAVRRVAGGWAQDAPDRPQLALGALLAGWAVDHSGLGLHHVLAQTAVRSAGLAHAHANAALLPATSGALRARAPTAFAALDADLGVPVEQLAARLRARAGADGLGALDDDEALLARAVEAAAARPELARLTPPPGRDELRALYRAAADSRSSEATQR
jgi:maleylacetate reductase